MSLSDKVFPLRMSNELYARLQRQAQRSCMTVTAYLRVAFSIKLEQDEATEPIKKRRK